MMVNEGTSMELDPQARDHKLMSDEPAADSVTQRMWLPSKGQVGFGIDFAVRLRPPVDAKEKMACG